MTTNYKQELTTLRQCIYDLQERYDKLLFEYRQECKHASVKHDKQYHSGGYDYSASTTHTYTCNDCGLSRREEDNHNSGFE